MQVVSIVGARPQFIKAAVVSRALRETGIGEIMVHTGQHYDHRMSDLFFLELDIRAPSHYLNVGSGTHGEQTAEMLSRIEQVLLQTLPDRVLVYGDTNSTLAGALAAAKVRLPVDHVEAGLRSFDRDMPEEVNRVLTDQLSDLLFCPTRTAVTNLVMEGISKGVHCVGDVMLDLAIQTRTAALAAPLPEGLREGGYFIATVHRASNTDDAERLYMLMTALERVGRDVAPVVLPVHPRLAARLSATMAVWEHIRRIPPVGYLEMQALILRARGVITDSGGVQKEAFFHGVQAITLRDSTEWTESVASGFNTLLGDDLDGLRSAALACGGRVQPPAHLLDEFGDGHAGSAIAELIGSARSKRRRWRR